MSPPPPSENQVGAPIKISPINPISPNTRTRGRPNNPISYSGRTPPLRRPQTTEIHFPMPPAATLGLIDRRVPGVAGVLRCGDLRTRPDAVAAAATAVAATPVYRPVLICLPKRPRLPPSCGS